MRSQLVTMPSSHPIKHVVLEQLLLQLATEQLPSEQLAYIRSCETPSTEPNGRKSFTVNAPCDKTGEVQVLNSRDIEWAFALSELNNPNTRFLLPQPSPIYTSHPHPTAKIHRPDFLSIYSKESGLRSKLIETKPSSYMAKKAAKYPDRYISIGPDKWDMPLSRAAAAKLGFDFEVITELNFNSTFIKNVRHLDDYRKYTFSVTDAEIEEIVAQVIDNPGIRMTEIRLACEDRCIDAIKALLAAGKIHTHLSDELLTKPNRVPLYATPIQERALIQLHASDPEGQICESPIELPEGQRFMMGGHAYRIVRFSEGILVIENHKGETSEHPLQNFLKLLPTINLLRPKLTRSEQMRRLDDKAFQKLLANKKRLQEFLENPEAPYDRTADRYRKLADHWQKTHGCGDLGLVPQTANRGSRVPIYPERTIAFMHEVIVSHYLQISPRPTIKDAHETMEEMMKAADIVGIPAYRTFARECQGWDKSLRQQRRWGHRIGHLSEAPTAHRSPFGNPHGDRPFIVAYADHTVQDVAQDHKDKDIAIKKAVHSLMVDGATNKIIASILRNEAPNTDTVILLLRDCVARNGTLPTILVCDWGADFRSRWLYETLCCILKIVLIFRPKAIGEAGSPVEQVFGVLNKRDNHRVQGSTEIMKRARLVTGKAKPNNHAIWTLQDLQEQHEETLKTWNSTPYGTNNQSPNEIHESLLRIHGKHVMIRISPDLLDRALLPYTKRREHRVDDRCRIFVNGAHYASEAILGKLRGECVEVRERPGDPREVFISHKSLQGIAPVPAVSAHLKYVDSALDATEAAFNKKQTPEAKKRKKENWSKHRNERTAREANIEARKKAEAKAAAAPRAREESGEKPQTTEIPKNVIPFIRPLGGMRNLRNVEAYK